MMKAMEAMLRDILIEILQDFAFLFAESKRDETKPEPDRMGLLSATITFRESKRCGEIMIAMSNALCREMAANILGVDAEETPVTAEEDAIKELANIIAGCFTAKCFGVDTTFSLEPPVARQIDAAAVARLREQPGTVCLWMEDGLVLGALHMY